MGSRGLNTLRRTFMGSVSDYVLHHVHVPVMIVPPAHEWNVSKRTADCFNFFYSKRIIEKKNSKFKLNVFIQMLCIFVLLVSHSTFKLNPNKGRVSSSTKLRLLHELRSLYDGNLSMNLLLGNTGLYSL